MGDVTGFWRIRRVGAAVVLAGGLLVGTVVPSTSFAMSTKTAQSLTSSSLTTTLVSGITLQNLDSSPVTAEIHFYNPDGTEVTNAAILNISLGVGQQQTWYTPSATSLPAGFAGSAVISASGKVGAIENIETPTDSTGTSPSNPMRVDTAFGVDGSDSTQSGPTLFAPQIMSNFSGWNTSLYVQNESNTTATTITVSYRDRFGNLVNVTDQRPIPPNASVTINQANDPGLGSFLGSAVVASNPPVPLGAIVNEFNVNNDSSTSQLITYNVGAQGAKKLYAPRVVNDFYGFNSGITVQNLDNATAQVTVTYYFPNATQTQNLTINPYASAAVYLPNATDSLGNALQSGSANGRGSAIITSNTNINGVVNEDNRVSPAFIGMGSAYNLFLDGKQTNTTYMPQLTSQLYCYASGVTVQNVGSSSGSGTLVLKDKSGNSVSVPTGTIAANATKIFYVPSYWTGSNFNGSGTITFSQPVVAVANISFRSDQPNCGSGGLPGSNGDSYGFYNAINQ